jgi:hypothetical protein
LTSVKADPDDLPDHVGKSQEIVMTPFLALVLTGYAVFVVAVVFGQIQCARATAKAGADPDN